MISEPTLDTLDITGTAGSEHIPLQEQKQRTWRNERETRNMTTTNDDTTTKLTIELVPQTCWGSNLRKFPGFPWDKARRLVAAAAGNRCEICGGRGNRHPVECHEVWSYHEPGDELGDELGIDPVQRLDRLIALCPACHTVKHWGLAMIRENRGEIPVGATLAHLCEVNGWSKDQATTHVDEAAHVWTHRSEFTWNLDLTEATAYGASPAVARVLPAKKRSAWSEA